MIRRLIPYLILMTWILAVLDWAPIHFAWWHNGQFPAYAGNWSTWSGVRTWAARILCPPCGALAENYYYVLLEIEAGDAEQAGVLPVGHVHNPLNPHGDGSFYWGQGVGAPWRRVSMLAFYLYWLPWSVAWWLVVGDLFRGRRPWWLVQILIWRTFWSRVDSIYTRARAPAERVD